MSHNILWIVITYSEVINVLDIFLYLTPTCIITQPYVKTIFEDVFLMQQEYSLGFPTTEN